MRSSLALAVLLPLAGVALGVLSGCAAEDAAGDLSDDDVDGEAYDGFAPKADGNSGLGGPITFGGACAAGPRATIAAVGDVLLHGPLQNQAIAAAARGHSSSENSFT